MLANNYIYEIYMPIPIKKTSFFIIPPTGSWRLFGQEEENKKIHIHEKYSPHPQIILPFIKRVYRYLSTTLCTIHPLPPPPRQENVVYKRFPLSSASPSFSSLLNREQDLVSPAWRASQSVRLYIGPRQIPYYAHQRFSALLFVLLRKREFFFLKNPALFFFPSSSSSSSSFPLFIIINSFRKIETNHSWFFFFCGCCDQHFWEEEKGERGHEENCIVYTNWYKKEVQIGCSW